MALDLGVNRAAREAPSVGRGRQTTAGPLLELSNVLPHFPDVAEHVPDGVLDRAEDVVGRLGEPVVDPQALPSRLDELRAPEVREVARCLLLRNPEAFVDVADAHFAREQKAEDPQSRGVGQRFEKPFHLRQMMVLHLVTRHSSLAPGSWLLAPDS